MDPGLGFPQNKEASARQAGAEASIRAGERELNLAFCYSRRELGNGFALEQGERESGRGTCVLKGRGRHT